VQRWWEDSSLSDVYDFTCANGSKWRFCLYQIEAYRLHQCEAGIHMDATIVLIRYQDVEGQLDTEGHWSWGLEGQLVTRNVRLLIRRNLVTIDYNCSRTRAHIRPKFEALDRPSIAGML